MPVQNAILLQHAAALTREKLGKIYRKTPDYPPYSPNLSSRDHHMFAPLKEELEGHHFNPGKSTSITRPNRSDRNTVLCVWWNQRGVVYYELLKLEEKVNTKRYQQLTNLDRFPLKKSPEY